MGPSRDQPVTGGEWGIPSHALKGIRRDINSGVNTGVHPTVCLEPAVDGDASRDRCQTG